MSPWASFCERRFAGTPFNSPSERGKAPVNVEPLSFNSSSESGRERDEQSQGGVRGCFRE